MIDTVTITPVRNDAIHARPGIDPAWQAFAKMPDSGTGRIVWGQGDTPEAAVTNVCKRLSDNPSRVPWLAGEIDEVDYSLEPT